MKTSRLFLFIIAFFLPFVMNGQTLDPANKAFKQGKYQDAAKLYETAGSLMKSGEREKVYDLAKKSRTCLSIQNDAEKEFKAHRYGKAKEKYQELLRINPSDQLAKNRIQMIPEMIELEASDHSEWETVKAISSIAQYNSYLSKYSNGYHRAEARDSINKIESRIRLAEEKKRIEKGAYSLFESERSIEKGLEYLNNYPAGEYAGSVKSLLVDLYCENKDFANARLYAEETGKNSYVDEMEAAHKRALYAEEEKQAYTDFCRNPNRNSALIYLNSYPFGENHSAVSTWMVKSLCAEYRFEDAKNYVVDQSMGDYIKKCKLDHSLEEFKSKPSIDLATAILAENGTNPQSLPVRTWVVHEYCNQKSFNQAIIYASTDDLKQYVREKKEQNAYAVFKTNHTIPSGKEYLRLFPNSEHSEEVKNWLISALCKEARFEDAKMYAGENHSIIANINKEEENHVYNLFGKYPSVNTAEKYIAQYPSGVYSNDVKDWLVKYYCDSSDFEKATAYAYNDNLRSFVQSSAKRYYRQMKKAAFTTDQFASHFLNLQIGYSPQEETGMLGLHYAYIPSKYGFYLSGTYFDEAFSALIGPTIRFTNDTHNLDFQLYGGAGAGFIDGEKKMALDLGIRFGWQSGAFSFFDLTIGVQSIANTAVFYGGFGIGVPLVLLFALGA